MIEIHLKYDNMHTFGIFNVFICINNHVNSCINSMLSAHAVQGGTDVCHEPCESTHTPGRPHVARGLAYEGPTG